MHRVKDDLILYSREGCGKCKVIKQKLNSKNIGYLVEENELPAGVLSLPAGKYQDKILNFQELVALADAWDVEDFVCEGCGNESKTEL